MLNGHMVQLTVSYGGLEDQFTMNDCVHDFSVMLSVNECEYYHRNQWYPFISDFAIAKGPFTQSVSLSGNASNWVQNPFTLQH